ncbi:aminopeptidase [Selenomonadales bacterium OttesenSCG-928-I06]|nr:aminopeptidase [Selenomonadales bacterium OttesenSCG-928-I06]
MNLNNLEKYAELIVKRGLNLQKDQILVINSPIECAPFAREVAKAAYLAGAKDVVINYKDELFSKIRFLHAPDIVFEEFPDWQKDFYLTYLHQKAAFLSIAASDPEIFKDVDPNRLSTAQKVANTALKEYREKVMNNENAWCVVSVPTIAWAKKVFSHLPEDKAYNKLFDVILKTVRVDTEDPIKAWDEHKDNLNKRADYLNKSDFSYLIFKNSAGTDLKLELAEDHVWLSALEYTPEGIGFIANMPTEEVFSMPKKTGVNGTVVSSKPLNYNGNLIDNFSLTFKDGKVVDFSAKKGSEVLKRLLEMDEGAPYLGEVALVPVDSPISNSGILFYNTLFDENASCHLALGKAYNVCLKDGTKMSQEQLAQKGANDSLIHVDFMIGTKDLSIIGVTKDGKEQVVFQDGNFAI